ncbi:hypothetical protein PIIN_11595 [Serendipita indica DSM 11827]|uniref:Uncharacterized protein n=1 Tax=Serendipita indica (strain DSM 11827) TaxID=1109443 RepID=G4U225_SERID|nr:hypothetical protein PIIN_11595 [Serendipita indica DSM 11827]
MRFSRFVALFASAALLVSAAPLPVLDIDHERMMNYHLGSANNHRMQVGHHANQAIFHSGALALAKQRDDHHAAARHQMAMDYHDEQRVRHLGQYGHHMQQAEHHRQQLGTRSIEELD